MLEIKSAVDRYNAEDYTDPLRKKSDEQLLIDFAKRVQDQEKRGVGVGGMVHSTVSQLPAFMIEIAASGGTAPATKKAVKQTALKATKQFLKKAAGRTIKAMPKLQQRALSDYLERRVGTVSVDDAGNLALDPASTTPGSDFLRAQGDLFIEVFSEQLGEGFAPAGKTLLKKFGGEKAGKFLASKKSVQYVNRIMKGISKHFGGDNAVKEALRRGGFNGILEEMGEERIGEILRAALGTQDFGTGQREITPQAAWERYKAAFPGGDQALAEFISFAIPGVGRAGAGTVLNRFAKRREAKRAEQEENVQASDAQNDIFNRLAQIAEVDEEAAQQIFEQLDSGELSVKEFFERDVPEVAAEPVAAEQAVGDDFAFDQEEVIPGLAPPVAAAEIEVPEAQVEQALEELEETVPPEVEAEVAEPGPVVPQAEEIAPPVEEATPIVEDVPVAPGSRISVPVMDLDQAVKAKVEAKRRKRAARRRPTIADFSELIQGEVAAGNLEVIGPNRFRPMTNRGRIILEQIDRELGIDRPARQRQLERPDEIEETVIDETDIEEPVAVTERVPEEVQVPREADLEGVPEVEEAQPAVPVEEPDGFFKGDAYRLTGRTVEEAGRTFNVVEMLEGRNQGEERIVPLREDVEARVEQKRKEFEEQQAGFRRVRERQEAEKVPEVEEAQPAVPVEGGLVTNPNRIRAEIEQLKDFSPAVMSQAVKFVTANGMNLNTLRWFANGLSLGLTKSEALTEARRLDGRGEVAEVGLPEEDLKELLRIPEEVVDAEEVTQEAREPREEARAEREEEGRVRVRDAEPVREEAEEAPAVEPVAEKPKKKRKAKKKPVPKKKPDQFRAPVTDIIESAKPADKIKIRALMKKMLGDEAAKNLKFVDKILSEGRNQLGAYREGLTKIADGQARPEDTTLHEAFHQFKDRFALPKEIETIDKAIKGDEAQAEKFVRYVNTGKGVFGSVRRVYERLKRRLKAFRGKGTEMDRLFDVYDKLASGVVAERGPVREAVAEADQFRAEAEIRPADISVIEDEAKRPSTPEAMAMHNTKAIIKELLWEAAEFDEESTFTDQDNHDINGWKAVDDLERAADVENSMEEAGDLRTPLEIYEEQLEFAKDDPDLVLEDFDPGDPDLIELAVRAHGLTDDLAEAGYILPDGRLLDFSGKREGGPSGTRNMDHRQLSFPHDTDFDSPTDVMNAFMRETGAVRMDANSGSVDLEAEPTSKQLSVIEDVFDNAEGGFVDLHEEGRPRASFEVSDGAERKATGQIRRYFRGDDIGTGKTLFRGETDLTTLDGVLNAVDQGAKILDELQKKPSERTLRKQAQKESPYSGSIAAILSGVAPEYRRNKAGEFILSKFKKKMQTEEYREFVKNNPKAKGTDASRSSDQILQEIAEMGDAGSGIAQRREGTGDVLGALQEIIDANETYIDGVVQEQIGVESDKQAFEQQMLDTFGEDQGANIRAVYSYLTTGKNVEKIVTGGTKAVPQFLLKALTNRIKALDKATTKRERKAIAKEIRGRVKVAKATRKAAERVARAEAKEVIKEERKGLKKQVKVERAEEAKRVQERAEERLGVPLLGKGDPKTALQVTGRAITAALKKGRRDRFPLDVRDAVQASFKSFRDRAEQAVRFDPELNETKHEQRLLRMDRELRNIETDIKGMTREQSDDYLRVRLSEMFGVDRQQAMRRATRGDVMATFDVVRDELTKELQKEYGRQAFALFVGSPRTKELPTGKKIKVRSPRFKPTQVASIMRKAATRLQSEVEAIAAPGKADTPADRAKNLIAGLKVLPWRGSDFGETPRASLQDFVNRARGINRRSKNVREFVGMENKERRDKQATAVADEIEKGATKLKGADVADPRKASILRRAKMAKRSLPSIAVALAGGNKSSITYDLFGRQTREANSMQLGFEQNHKKDLGNVLDNLDVSKADKLEIQIRRRKQTLSNGQTINWTGAQRITLYGMLQDEQLREKVINNGIRLLELKDDADKTIRGEGATPAERYSNMVQLVREIVGGMTQQEKDIATWMVTDMTEIGSIGNEVSRNIDGKDWFTSESHFPATGAVDREAAKWEDTDPAIGKRVPQGLVKMVDNFGLTKERVPHKHTMLIGNAFKIYEDQIRDMSVFISYAELQRDVNNVLNDRDVRKSIVQRWGKGLIPQMKEYYEALTYQRGASDGWGVFQRAAAWVQRQFSVSILGFRMSSIALNRVGGTIMNATWLAANKPKALPAYLALAANPLKVPFKILTKKSKDTRDELLNNGYFRDRWVSDAFRVFGQTPREQQKDLAAGANELKEIGKLRYRQLQQLGVSGMAWAEMRNVIELVHALEKSGVTEGGAAVELAEQITRETQNPSTPLEETILYRDIKKSGIGGLFLPFMGQPSVIGDYVGQQIDIARDEAKTNKTKAVKRIGVTLLGAVLAGLYAVLQRAIVRLASKGLLTGDEPDDKEKIEQALFGITDALQELADIGFPGLGRLVDFPVGIVETLRTGKRGKLSNLQRPGTITGRMTGSGIMAIRELMEWKQTGDIDVDEAERIAVGLNNSLFTVLGLPSGGLEQAARVGKGLAGLQPLGKSKKKRKRGKGRRARQRRR
jgi:hypothetical protein